jgi:VWFA-related protein
MLDLARSVEGLKAGGSTSMYDALYCALVSGVANGRRLVLLFSDGRDNRSWLSAADVVRVAQTSSAVIHAITFKAEWSTEDVIRAPSTVGPDRRALEAVTRSTGGRVFTVDGAGHLSSAFDEAVAEMRSRYVLTYYPQEAGGRGWHALSVRVKSRPVRVVARPGYLVQ